MAFIKYEVKEDLETITRPRLEKDDFINRMVQLAKTRGNTMQASMIKAYAQDRYVGGDLDDDLYNDMRKAFMANGCFIDNDLDLSEAEEEVPAEPQNTSLELDSDMLQYIMDNDVKCKMWNDGEEPIYSTLITVWDREIHTAPYESAEHNLYQYIEPIVEEAVLTEDRKYNWRDVYEVLSDYFDDETSISLYNIMAAEYHDHDMTEADMQEILSDLKEYDFDDAKIQEIADRCAQTTDPTAEQKDVLESDILTLQDAADKLYSPEAKEKLIDLIASLKNQPTSEEVTNE